MKSFLKLFLAPYPYSLILFTALLLVGLVGSHRDLGLSMRLLWGAFFQVLATGYIAWAVVYSHQMLKEQVPTFSRLMDAGEESQRARTWVEREIFLIYRGTGAYVIFALIATGIVGTVAMSIGSPLSGVGLQQVVFYLAVAFLGLSAGFGGSTVFLIGRFMVRYARQRLHVSVFQYPDSPFRFIGRLQLRFAWITSAGYFFAAAMLFLYWGLNISVGFWLLFGACSVIGFFLAPQLGFHRKLKAEKQAALDAVSKEIQRRFEATVGEQEPGAIKRLKEAYEVAEMVAKLPVWPFNMRALVSLGSTVLLPAVVTLLSVVVERLIDW